MQDTCMYLANAMLLDAATVNDIHAFKYCTCTSSGDQSTVVSIVMYPASSNTLYNNTIHSVAIRTIKIAKLNRGVLTFQTVLPDINDLF